MSRFGGFFAAAAAVAVVLMLASSTGVANADTEPDDEVVSISPQEALVLDAECWQATWGSLLSRLSSNSKPNCS